MRGLETWVTIVFWIGTDSLADIRGRLREKKPVERLTEKIARLGFAPTPAPRSPGSRRRKTGCGS
jgi:hypothetical protein